METVSIQFIIHFFGVLTIISHAHTTSDKNTARRGCQSPKNGQELCFCGKDRVMFDRLIGDRCIKGEVVRKYNHKSIVPSLRVLRLSAKPLHQSTRDDIKALRCSVLRFKRRPEDTEDQYVPLKNVSVEASIDSFAADVTLTQVFVNQEQNPIEAIYVFPMEENAAVYSFTAQIDDRTITAILKEKKTAEKEYKTAKQQGHTAVLLRQNEETLDTFTINVGALPAGKECRIKIQYVTELDLIDGSSIRFVVPTTIALRYSPSLGHLQSPDKIPSKYVQKTPYSMSFQAHILRREQYKINQVANRSHPVNVRISEKSIDVSAEGIALDRDIILDIDLPENRVETLVSIEQSTNSPSQHAVLLAFTPRLTDFMKIHNGTEEINTEFIFIVDCSGSMAEESRISLAKEAMLFFIRSLPVGARFNIIRFGSNYDILFKSEEMTAEYNERTAKEAENLTRSLEANFGGTELLGPLKYLQKNPPIIGRSRQIFLLTDGEITNTNAVIDLCRSMSSTTRIFSFGLGYSSSRSLVKGLARSTNGHFVFIPPNSKVDTYVGSQFGRAFQPSLVNATLQWHGLASKGLQAPKIIPPLYVNDRVLIYELLEDGHQLKKQNVSVDLMVGNHKINSIKLSGQNAVKKDTIRRLAAKALIQEIQHEKQETVGKENESTVEERITSLSINHQILSPYTAFVGVESSISNNNSSPSKVRHVPVQIAKGDEHLMRPSYSSSSMPSGAARHHFYDVPPPPPRPQFFRSRNEQRKYLAKVHDYHAIVARFRFESSVLSSTTIADSSNQYSPHFYNAQPVVSVSTTTTSSLLSFDPVRWLVDQHSFNGAWILNEQDIQKLTNGKLLTTFESTITKNKDALTTALAIALLEMKYADQTTLWYRLVEKGRKQLNSYGLNNDQINALINEIKNKL